MFKEIEKTVLNFFIALVIMSFGLGIVCVGLLFLFFNSFFLGGYC